MCGIFGIYSENYTQDNLKMLIDGLKLLQHRGKDGYGFAYLTKQLNCVKGHGLIKNIIPPAITTASCIGHLRYSTSGYSTKTGLLKLNENQPLLGHIGQKTYYLVHNGNVPNIDGHDTTYINHLIMSYDNLPMEKILIDILEKIPAAYSIMILTDTALFVMRDRFGIRPLCLGWKDDNYYVSSESCVFTDINYLRDVVPGELIRIDHTGITTVYIHPKSQLSLCSFEILYFLSEHSFTDGMGIYNIRSDLGRTLASKETIINDNNNGDYIVIGIPETGICSGKAYAKHLHLTYSQAIIKNKNQTRTFIILKDEDRKKACANKFFYKKELLENKNIIIVDDTIVRGNIIKSIIENLRNCNVREIHIRIPAPPVIDICELGIAIQSKEELIMNNKTIDNVTLELGVDSLVYLTVEDLVYFPENSYNQCFTSYIDPIIKNFKPVDYLQVGPANIIKKQKNGNKKIAKTSNLYGINTV